MTHYIHEQFTRNTWTFLLDGQLFKSIQHMVLLFSVCVLDAQLVKHCASNTEIMGSNPVEPHTDKIHMDWMHDRKQPAKCVNVYKQMSHATLITLIYVFLMIKWLNVTGWRADCSFLCLYIYCIKKQKSDRLMYSTKNTVKYLMFKHLNAITIERQVLRKITHNIFRLLIWLHKI